MRLTFLHKFALVALGSVFIMCLLFGRYTKQHVFLTATVPGPTSALQYALNNVDLFKDDDILQKEIRQDAALTIKPADHQEIRRIVQSGLKDVNAKSLGQLPREMIAEIYHRYMNTLQFLCHNKDMIGGVLSGRYACSGFSTNGKCLVYLITDGKVSTFFERDVENIYKCGIKRIKASDMRNELASLKKDIPLTDQLTVEDRIDVLIINGGDSGVIADGLLKRGALRHVDQLSVDFLLVNNVTSGESYTKHILILKALYEEGFRIFHFGRDQRHIFENNPWRTGGYTLNLMRERRVDDPITIPKSDKITNRTEKTVMSKLFSYLLSSEVLCRELLRVGNIGDGGWDVCVDDKYRPCSPCLVYSFGIKDDWSFDDRIASRFGCEVHSFDPSIGLTDHRRSKLQWYHNLGLSDKNGAIEKRGIQWNMMNMKSIRTSLGHTNRPIDILKMDIEFSEWIAFPDMLETGVLKDVRQLYIEFHFKVDRGYFTVVAKYFKILNKLHELGFRLFWSHPNQLKTNIRKSKYAERQVSCCYELYYVNINF
ncbi:uncharacterized protein [Argopecten irradians]|uniref:uncharacterized protein n=1 Tax=Argopecten irradians TaxID=31199 RepID=UPI0037168766